MLCLMSSISAKLGRSAKPLLCGFRPRSCVRLQWDCEPFVVPAAVTKKDEEKPPPKPPAAGPVKPLQCTLFAAGSRPSSVDTIPCPCLSVVGNLT